MQTRKFDEMISYFNRKVSDMYIDRKYKIELLAMIAAIGMAHEKELDAQQEQRWIPCSERLPDKSGMYLITEQNYGFKVDAICKNVVVHPSYFSVDEKEFKDTVYIPDCSNITAWMPLPEPYMRGEQE